MGNEIILITGGGRSGKSAFAQRMAEDLSGSRIFVATCRAGDAEMADRIARHREERRGRGWRTVEEPLDLVGVLAAVDSRALVLVDCLTLWIANLLFDGEADGRHMGETEISRAARDLVAAARQRSGPVLMVTNEVGAGIVPDNPLARLYRDLVGRCNQEVAAAADRVYLVTCGLPISIK